VNRKLLDLIPTHYLCPYCGEWHEWPSVMNLGWYDFDKRSHFECYNAPNKCNKGDYSIYFEDDYCYYSTEPQCGRGNLNLSGSIEIDSITQSSDEPIVTFNVPFNPANRVRHSFCSGCMTENICNLLKLTYKGYDDHMEITLGFKFEQSEYDKITKRARRTRKKNESQQSTSNPSEQQQAEQSVKKEIKEDNNMAKTTIWEQLYEHSPKENIDIAKEWVSKYKPTLKWVVPVLAIYSAYRILNSKNSGFDINNIYSEAKKKLGFGLESLKDKEALNQLMVLGGLSATAYAAIKGISSIYGKDTGELGVDDLEEGMEKLDGARKKFGWIQPKTEALLPVAVSVIIVYVMTQKPAWFEAVKEKASALTGNFSSKMNVYLDMAKLFIADKFKLDLENDEEVKKMKSFFFLAAIVGIGVFLYGKKILGDKAAEDGKDTGLKNEKLKAFMSQLLSIMKKLMPTAFSGFATFLITKNVMKDDVIDAEFSEVVDTEEMASEGDVDAEFYCDER